MKLVIWYKQKTELEAISVKDQPEINAEKQR